VIVLASFVRKGDAADVDNEYTRRSLAKLKAVLVTVLVDSTSEGKRNQEMELLIRTDAELKVRREGLTILDQAQHTASLGGPMLSVWASYIRVSTPELDKYLGGLYVYTAGVSILQDVRLERDTEIRSMMANTWGTSMVGKVAGNEFQKTVRGNLDDMMNKFINAYLSVNPELVQRKR
jgi:hypothetical protein